MRSSDVNRTWRYMERDHKKIMSALRNEKNRKCHTFSLETMIANFKRRYIVGPRKIFKSSHNSISCGCSHYHGQFCDYHRKQMAASARYEELITVFDTETKDIMTINEILSKKRKIIKVQR